MKSLEECFFYQGINPQQIKCLAQETHSYIIECETKVEIIQNCINRLWIRWDTGGHSCGRSLRSLLLENVKSWYHEGDFEKVKQGIAILIAMYCDYKYINQHNWYDFELTDSGDVSFFERSNFFALALVLNVNNIPEMDDWSEDKIISFINS